MWCTCMFSCALLECVDVCVQQDGGCMIGSHCVSNISDTAENVNIADRLKALFSDGFSDSLNVFYTYFYSKVKKEEGGFGRKCGTLKDQTKVELKDSRSERWQLKNICLRATCSPQSDLSWRRDVLMPVTGPRLKDAEHNLCCRLTRSGGPRAANLAHFAHKKPFIT